MTSMLWGFLDSSPETDFPVTTLNASTTNSVITVTTTAALTTNLATRSAGSVSLSCSTAAISAWSILDLDEAPPKRTITSTKTTRQIQKISQYSHSILCACGPAGLRDEWLLWQPASAMSATYASLRAVFICAPELL